MKEDRKRKISARQSSRVKLLKSNRETKVIPSSIGAIFGKSANPPNTRDFQFGSLSELEPVQYSPSCTEYTALRKTGVKSWAGQAGQFFERKKNKNQKLIKMLSALSLASDPPRLIIGVNGDGHAASYRPVEVSCMLLFQFEFNLYVYNKIYFLGRPLSLRVGADLCERAKAGADFVVALQVDSAHVNISKKVPLPRFSLHLDLSGNHLHNAGVGHLRRCHVLTVLRLALCLT